GGAGGAFRAILQGLNQDLPNLNANLDELGIRNIRDRRVVSALAQQWDRVQGILTQTSGAFAENTTLSQAYSMVLDDLSSQFQIFLNALENAAAAAGSTLAPALTDLLGVATDLLVAFAGFAQSDFGKFLLNLLAPIAAISAGVAAFRGGIALATASFIGLRQALGPIGGIAKGVAGQLGMLGLVSGRAAAGIDRTSSSAESASRSTGRFSAAMGRMGRAAVANWDIVLSAAILAQAAIRQAMQGTEASTEELANAIRTDLGSALDVADNGTSPIINNFSALAAVFEQIQGRAFDLGDALRLVADSPVPDVRWNPVLADIENLVSGTSRARDAIENVGDALASMDASQAQKSARQMVEEFRLTEDRM